MTIKHRDWAAVVKELWGPAYYEPDVVYQQSNGRVFKESRGGPGIFAINLSSITVETVDRAQGRAPDLITEDHKRLLEE